MPTVYPVTNTLPPTNGSSNGSYGAVFIVLAVIITISAFACFLGRLCNKGQNVSRPSTQSQLPRKEKDAKSNTNGIQTKDGDIEFGYDKRFASAKVATTNEPVMARPDPFGEPSMVRPNSFREPTISQPTSFHKTNKVQPSSLHEPSMGRPSSFHEPTMGQSNSFRNGDSQGRQVRFGGDQDNEINFKIRTRPNRY
ncbi:hypothetical protein L1987_57705 [Smallanthus sonchifolius]|uniref:Uncharacterized protein n=1 Tax=Smallanthus sonchifolius TaxID=185202 RepID=A0ACB9DDB1_9ASTR|nr:hypothetical protein L1987_57705 [Smallanthus sonchifolius]